MKHPLERWTYLSWFVSYHIYRVNISWSDVVSFSVFALCVIATIDNDVYLLFSMTAY